MKTLECQAREFSFGCKGTTNAERQVMVVLC